MLRSHPLRATRGVSCNGLRSSGRGAAPPARSRTRGRRAGPRCRAAPLNGSPEERAWRRPRGDPAPTSAPTPAPPAAVRRRQAPRTASCRRRRERGATSAAASSSRRASAARVSGPRPLAPFSPAPPRPVPEVPGGRSRASWAGAERRWPRPGPAGWGLGGIFPSLGMHGGQRWVVLSPLRRQLPCFVAVCLSA